MLYKMSPLPLCVCVIWNLMSHFLLRNEWGNWAHLSFFLPKWVFSISIALYFFFNFIPEQSNNRNCFPSRECPNLRIWPSPIACASALSVSPTWDPLIFFPFLTKILVRNRVSVFSGFEWCWIQRHIFNLNLYVWGVCVGEVGNKRIMVIICGFWFQSFSALTSLVIQVLAECIDWNVCHSARCVSRVLECLFAN